MILVPMILHSAVTGKSKTLGSIVIINDGTGTATKANYTVKIIGKSNNAGSPIRKGRVRGYRRKARPQFELIIEALLSCGYTAKEK